MICVYLLAGAAIGILATMFGFGGGFIVVPLLFWLLSFTGVPKELAMHMAVGTSLMLMFINMVYASWLHYLKNNMDMELLKTMFPLVAVGAGCGALIANLISATLLRSAFLLLMCLVLIRNVEQEFVKETTPSNKKPTNPILYLVSYSTGVIGGLLGIGGSVIIVPFFRHYGLPMNKASAIANGLAVPGSLIGSIIFIASGLHVSNLPPYSTGYLYWPALFFILLGSFVSAKIGIHFSSTIPDSIYGKIYCLLLVIVILSMIFG
ncbi:MAG: sulfite exporter TauE/SafE family protein [Legionella sp.]